MANPLFGGYNTTGYGGGAGSNLSSLYSSAADQYHPGDSASLLGATTARYLPSDPYSSAFSSSFSSLADRTSLYSDYLSGGYSARAAWPGPPGVEAGSSFTSADAFAGYKRPSAAEALYRQTLLGTNSTLGQSDAWYATNALAKRPRFEFGSNLPVYPQRLGEKDCAHYMLTRTCKFGESCKFDHPIWVPEGGIPDWKEVPLAVTNEAPPERPGEPDCPYFIKTQKCKFGPRCKFNHPKERIAPLGVAENADPSQLPQRPSEPPCAFYTKTGNCKFGASCKFHHPKDIVIPVSGQVNGTGNEEAFKSGSVMPVQPIAAPASLHNSKGLPVRPGEVDCPFYLKTGSCKYGATCRYNHPDIYATNPPAGAAAFATTPAAHLNFGVVNPAASMVQSIDPRLNQSTLGLGPGIYPQRPGQIECDFYMKSGECKFGERCKFHHPINRFAPTQLAKESQQENVKLTLAGLPRREGAVHCPYYMKTGACKYGATCKFDHPPPGEVMSSATTGASAAGVQKKEAETTPEQQS